MPVTHPKVMTPAQAAALIHDDDTVATGGFVGIGFPEELAIALEERFRVTGTPRRRPLAQAVRNSGGVVLVQVERLTREHRVHPQLVQIPGALVDAVVVARPEHHPQTYAEHYNPGYTGEVRSGNASPAALPLDARKIIARR